jgi:hypothetical protein
MFPPLPCSLPSRLSPIVLLLHLICIYPSRLSVYYPIRVTAEAGGPRAWPTYFTTLPIYGSAYIPIRVRGEASWPRASVGPTHSPLDCSAVAPLPLSLAISHVFVQCMLLLCCKCLFLCFYGFFVLGCCYTGCMFPVCPPKLMCDFYSVFFNYPIYLLCISFICFHPSFVYICACFRVHICYDKDNTQLNSA